jgi:hypothetical protein
MSSTLRNPATTALSAHRRAADQNAILCAAQQKRFGEPPRRYRAKMVSTSNTITPVCFLF